MRSLWLVLGLAALALGTSAPASAEISLRVEMVKGKTYLHLEDVSQGPDNVTISATHEWKDPELAGPAAWVQYDISDTAGIGDISVQDCFRESETTIQCRETDPLANDPDDQDPDNVYPQPYTGMDLLLGGGDDVVHSDFDSKGAGPKGEPFLFADGGEGSDRLIGDSGRDLLVGGPGNDLIAGGYAIDLLYGLDGNDRLYGQQQPDLVDGGRGRDRVVGGKYGDLLRGGPGRDRCSGGHGFDRAKHCERTKGVP
jgi:RTX calcium-binding nonapeptide repeat (4 copies)